MPPPDPAVATPKQLMTADEFWDFVNLPENEGRVFDLIRGKVVEVSRPTRMHGITTGTITRLLGNWVFAARRGYVASNDAGVLLREDPDSVVGPDVAYYTDANTVEEVHPKWGEVPPVVAVEVLSPNDKLTRVNMKIHEYLSSGTQYVWLVDYEERTVTVYRPDRPFMILKANDELAAADVLPGFSCRVADLFAIHDPTTPSPTAS